MRRTRELAALLIAFTLSGVSSDVLGAGRGATANVIEAPAPGPRLSISTGARALFGDSLTILATGLTPGASYVLRLTIRDYWGAESRSNAGYIAAGDGSIDLRRDPPVSGSYAGVDPLGLFWSAEPSGPAPSVTPSTAPLDSVVLDVELRGDQRSMAKDRRRLWLAAPGVTRTPFQNASTRGVLFMPRATDARRVGVVLLGGSGGGLAWQQVAAAALASRGFPALALGYFNLDSLPKELERIPLDGVRDAASRLPGLAGDATLPIVVIGLSKGAELALLVAASTPAVRGVVAFAPSFTAFQSFPSLITGSEPASSWTDHGADVTYAPLRREQPFRANEPGDRAWIQVLIHNPAAADSAAIAVENIRGPVLLFSGMEDRVWPSTMMADRVIARLRTHAFRHAFRHVAFEEVGHAFAAPGYLPTAAAAQRNGGSARATAWAQRTSWELMIRFLEGVGAPSTAH